jgi:hypothetical protein
MKSTYFVVAYESDHDSDYVIVEKIGDAWLEFTDHITSDWFRLLLKEDPRATVTLYASTYEIADPWDKFEDENDDVWCWWEHRGQVVTLETFPERAA